MERKYIKKKKIIKKGKRKKRRTLIKKLTIFYCSLSHCTNGGIMSTMNYICSNRTKGKKASFQPGQAGLKVNEAYGGRTVPKKAGGTFRNNALVGVSIQNVITRPYSISSEAAICDADHWHIVQHNFKNENV